MLLTTTCGFLGLRTSRTLLLFHILKDADAKVAPASHCITASGANHGSVIVSVLGKDEVVAAAIRAFEQFGRHGATIHSRQPFVLLV